MQKRYLGKSGLEVSALETIKIVGERYSPEPLARVGR